ncbi:MAG: DUF456 domain-containing protein [Candidatus Peribacteraceae bacterium]|nr:DUF456 domain-containing protein [Candidatus Peribacteraceae bacterium]
MANTPNTQNQPFTLDREDPSAQRQSTRQQWNALSHLLHLPTFQELQNAPLQQQQVAQNIANVIATVRGQAGQADQIRELLLGEFGVQNLADTGASGTPPLANRLPDTQFAIADAWLNVIYRNITEEDVRQMVNQLPLAIRVADGTDGQYWNATGVDLGIPPPRNVQIDLRHPLWATGTQAEIQRKLVGMSPEQAGITLDPAAPAGTELDAAMVGILFGLKQNVIDPQLPVRQMELPGFPAAGNRTIIDLPGLLRQNSAIASMDLGALQTYFTGLGSVVFDQNIQAFTNAGVRIIPFPPAAITGVLTRMFQAMSRSPGAALCAKQSTLSNAVREKEPLNKLLAGSADNRELLLALTTIQRDPSSLAVLQQASAEATLLNGQLTENEQLLSTALAAKELKTMQPPPLSQAQLGDGVNAMRKVMQFASGGAGLETGTVINLRTGMATPPGGGTPYSVGGGGGGVGLTPAEVNEANRAGLASILTRIVVPNVRTGEIQRDNSDAFQKVVEQAQKMVDKYEEDLRKIGNIAGALTTMGNTMADREVRNIASYPLLTRYFNWTGGVPPAQPTFIVNAGDIDATFNGAALEREYRNALLLGNPAKSLNLEEVDSYEKKKSELMEKLKEASAKAKLEAGPNDAWAVVQRGLEHQGLRGKGLDNTLKYMKTRVELTPESARDTQALVEAAYPYLPPAEDEQRTLREWAGGRNYRTAASLWMERYNVWEEYRNRLFSPERLGIGWGEQFENDRRIPVSRLVDAYFRMKYLQNLPETDPRRLPQSRDIVQRMRRLHGTIIRRAQEHYRYASGMSDEDIRQLRGQGLETDPKAAAGMTATERLQAIHSFLQDGDAAYSEKNKDVIEKMADGAYRPVRQRIESHERSIQRTKNYAWNNNLLSARGLLINIPIVYPAKGVWWGVKETGAGLRGAGRFAAARKKSIGIGAAIGLLAGGPVGAVFGGFIGSAFKGGGSVTPAHH